MATEILRPAGAGYLMSLSKAADLYRRFEIVAGQGSFALSGINATLLKNAILSADPGNYVVAGSDAGLIYTSLAQRLEGYDA